MQMVGKVAKEFAQSPMLLANEYGLFDPSFFSNLTGQDLLFADMQILSSIAKAENEATKESRDKQKEARDHPGMERYSDPESMWDEAEMANREAKKD
jgi:hypothetical protein